MAGTDVIYNGVTINNCLTLNFHEEAVREDTNTDTIGHKFRIKVRGTIHLQNPSIHGIGEGSSKFGGDDVSSLHQAIRKKLMEDRRSFQYKLGGTILVEAKPYNEPGPRGEPPRAGRGPVRNKDVNNGPKPQSFDIVQWGGTRLVQVEYEIEFTILDCELSSTVRILSNRWSVSDSLDADFYTQRTWTGQLRIVSASENPLGPQAFRSFVIPPLQNGFLRDHIECTTSKDGLTLSYTIRDKQTSNAPPSPATRWAGTHEVRGDPKGTIHTLNIQLWGRPNTDKKTLIGLAFVVALDRIKNLGLPDTGGHTQEASIRDHLNKRSVELTVRYKESRSITDLASLSATGVGTELGISNYNKFQGRVPRLYGSATTTGLFVAYLQSPCWDDHSINRNTGGETGGSTVTSNNQTATETYEGEVPALQDSRNPYSSQHLDAQYTFYEIDNDFPLDEHVVQIPIAAKQGDTVTDTSVALPIARTTARRIITVHAERMGRSPMINRPAAKFTADGITYTLIGMPKLNFASPPRTVDSTQRLFTVTAVYTYAMSRPIAAGSQIPITEIPYESEPVDRLNYSDVFL